MGVITSHLPEQSKNRALAIIETMNLEPFVSSVSFVIFSEQSIRLDRDHTSSSHERNFTIWRLVADQVVITENVLRHKYYGSGTNEDPSGFPTMQETLFSCYRSEQHCVALIICHLD